MNPQWNTPPNGDFASYVERLSKQAALPRREHEEGEHGLDVGMTPSAEPHGEVSEAIAQVRRRMQSNGDPRAGGQRTQVSGGAAFALAKVLGILWVIALVLLLAFSAPIGTVIMLFALGVWVAHRLRRWALPPGAASWRQWLEAEARKQRNKNGK